MSETIDLFYVLTSQAGSDPTLSHFHFYRLADELRHRGTTARCVVRVKQLVNLRQRSLRAGVSVYGGFLCDDPEIHVRSAV